MFTNVKDWKGLPIGLGLAALGRPGYINLGHDEDVGSDKSVEVMETQAHRVLDAAWEAGVRYYDAARSYGRAEEFLANWIISREIAPEEIFVASKWGYRYTANWQVEAEAHEIKEHSLAHLQSQYQESKALLGKYLNLYQIHSATLESGVLENDEVLDELAGLKAAGLEIGLSLSGASQAETLDKALAIERDGTLLFNAVQATWNILEPSAGEALKAAHDAGMRVIVKEALANGRLSPRNEAPEFAEKQRVLAALAEKKGNTIDALTIAAVLAQTWADLVLSGAARVEHLKSNLTAVALSLEADELAALLELKERPQEYWQTRSQQAWN